jgi:hypothetical protein
MKTRSLSGRNVAGYVATIGRKVLSAVAFAEAPYENDSQSRATGDGQAIPILVLFSKLISQYPCRKPSKDIERGSSDKGKIAG